MAILRSFEPAVTVGDSPLSVIYVMGAGRSGSTILGVALGNCKDVFYAGELEAWLRRSGRPNFAGVERAKFWEGVRTDVGGRELFGDEVWRHLEYSLAWFRPHSWARRQRLRSAYRQVVIGLYRAIASSTGATYVVDTSHYPLRAREIQQLDDIDLYLIYLVRNPLSVVASFKRRDVTNASKSLLSTNAYLSLTHLLSIFVFLRHRADRRLLLRYEDLVANPERTMRCILDWAGASVPLPDLEALKTGIPFQGNRLLACEQLALRREPTSVSPGSRGLHITKLFQLPWTLVLSRLRPRAKLTPSTDEGS